MGRRRRFARVAAVVVALAMGPTALSNCVPPDSPEPEMACCRGHHDCGSTLKTPACCTIQQGNDTRQIPLKKDAQAPIPLLRPVAGPASVVPALPSARVVDARAARARAPSPPIYVLASAYLI